MDEDPVRVSAERAIQGGERERLRRGELEANLDKMPARAFPEVVPAIENLARSSRKFRLTPPIKLNTPQTFMSDDRRAKIGARQFRRRRHRAFDRGVDSGVDEFGR